MFDSSIIFSADIPEDEVFGYRAEFSGSETVRDIYIFFGYLTLKEQINFEELDVNDNYTFFNVFIFFDEGSLDSLGLDTLICETSLTDHSRFYVEYKWTTATILNSDDLRKLKKKNEIELFGPEDRED